MGSAGDRSRVRPIPEEPLSALRGLVALIGAAVIRGLMRVFGRVVRESSVTWLSGPIGGDYIGDRPYEEVAAREDLEIVRRSSTGGLLPDMGDCSMDPRSAPTS